MTDTISAAAVRKLAMWLAVGAVCTVYWALQRWSSHQRLWKDSNVSNVGHWARVVGYPQPQFWKIYLDKFCSTFTSRETWSIKTAPVRIRYNVDGMMGLPSQSCYSVFSTLCIEAACTLTVCVDLFILTQAAAHAPEVVSSEANVNWVGGINFGHQC